MQLRGAHDWAPLTKGTYMPPAMPRDLKAKATKIVFKIMGKPITMVRDVKPKTYIQQKLVTQETNKVR